MKPQAVILRAIGLPVVLLSAIFIGTQCNKNKPLPKPEPLPASSEEHKKEEVKSLSPNTQTDIVQESVPETKDEKNEAVTESPKRKKSLLGTLADFLPAKPTEIKSKTEGLLTDEEKKRTIELQTILINVVNDKTLSEADRQAKLQEIFNELEEYSNRPTN